ncbi:MAG: T9SS type A sorting domain-containing protein [Fibrobacteres bacterium]|nr:T9SS type A sorting domain-containing protein [Fibrobacterota bacterium]
MLSARIIALLLFLIFSIQHSDATVLSNMADTMKADTWVELPTNGFTQSLLWLPKDNGDCVFNYSDDLTWNPKTQEIYYLGGSHYGPGRQIAYRCSTNSWRQLPDQTWMPSLGHGYDHNAIDPVNQVFFHWPMSVRQTIYRMRISDGAWFQYNIPETVERWTDLACCRGLEFFPSLDQGSLVMCNGKNGKIISFSTKTGKFRTLASSLNRIGSPDWIGGYHNIVKFNHRYNIMVAGGGTASRRLWTVDSLGAIDTLPSAPYDVGIYTTATTCDPVTGDILMLAANGMFYTFSFVDSTWKTEPSTNIPFFSLGSRDIIYSACGSIPDHGVTVWCKYTHSASKVFLYKRAEPVAIERNRPILSTKGITIGVQPNPVKAIAIIRGLSPEKKIKLTLFSTEGRKVWEKHYFSAEDGSFSTSFATSSMPNGTYVIKAVSGSYTKTAPLVINR